MSKSTWIGTGTGTTFILTYAAYLYGLEDGDLCEVIKITEDGWMSFRAVNDPTGKILTMGKASRFDRELHDGIRYVGGYDHCGVSENPMSPESWEKSMKKYHSKPIKEIYPDEPKKLSYCHHKSLFYRGKRKKYSYCPDCGEKT